MPVNHTIPCPSCQTKILVDVQQLLVGVRFTCSGCGASIGIMSESKPIIEEPIKKLDMLKNDLKKRKS